MPPWSLSGWGAGSRAPTLSAWEWTGGRRVSGLTPEVEHSAFCMLGTGLLESWAGLPTQGGL